MNVKESIWHRDQTSIGRLSGYNGFEFGLAVNRSGRCLHPKGCCGGVEWRQVVVGKRRCCRIEQKSGSIDAGRNLLEQLQPFGTCGRLHDGKTSRVAAWPRQTANKAAPDRIGNNHKNNWDGTRLVQHRLSWRRVLRKNDIGLELQKFFSGLLPLVQVVECSPASVDTDVPIHPSFRSPCRNAPK